MIPANFSLLSVCFFSLCLQMGVVEDQNLTATDDEKLNETREESRAKGSSCKASGIVVRSWRTCSKVGGWSDRLAHLAHILNFKVASL